MPADLKKARELFLHAVGKLPPEQWDGYVAEACGGDAELGQQVGRLLQVHREAGSFLDRPAAALGATGAFTPVPGEEAATVLPREGVGTMIGPYKLLQQIGEGGMGTVFMAEQTRPVQRKVALKVIKAGMDSRQVIARFEAERQTLALMDHVNIARVFDGGATQAGRPYFVMELVHGVPITTYCDDHHLAPRQRLELFVPVCLAIQHAHQKGIIHRDIKPSNVMITLYDGKPVPKVIDFGVAKATEQKLTERTLFTQYGTMVGTLEYMSPEQAEMSALGVDTRSDIYSLGVLLYELLTGSTPLTHKRLKEAAYGEILRMIREEEPPRPSTRLSDSGAALASISAQRKTEPAKLSKLMRGELDWIVMKTLEKDRNRRYETPNSLAQDIQRYLADEAVQACPPSAGYRFRKFTRRNKRALATAALLGVMLLMAVGGVAGSIGWTTRDRAVRQAETAQQAQESLQAARSLMGESEFALARQKLAEAKGRIGGDRAPLRRLLDEVEALEAEMAQVEDFFALIDRAHDAETPGPMGQSRESERDSGKVVPLILQALARYGVVERDDWNSTLETSLLLPDQVLRIRRTTYESLLWLADDVVRRQEDRQGQKITSALAARQALVYLQKAEAAHRPTTAFYQIRSQCWKELKEEAAARADEQLARQTPATIAMDHYLLAQEAYEALNKPEAIKHFEAALRLEPTHYWSLMRLGWCLSYREPPDCAEAVRVYTGCIMKRPDHALAYFHRGIAYVYLRRHEDSVADYSKAIELDPKFAKAWRNRGAVYANLGQWDKALADSTKAIELDPKLAVARSNRGVVYERLGQLDKALADYSKAIELDANNLPALKNRNAVYFALGQWDKAVADLARILELAPDNAEPHNDLAWFLATCPDAKVRGPGQAVELAKKAVELSPKEGNYWNTLGVAHYRVGDWKACLETLEKSMEFRQGGDSYDWFFLAMAHWQLGHKDEAQKWHEKAVQWMQENEEALKKDKMHDEELRRFRAEVEELLKTENATVPK